MAVEEKNTEVATREKEVNASEIMDVIDKGKVLAPVGTRTFFAMTVDENGQIRMAGKIAIEHVDDLAFFMMAQKRKPQEEKMA